MALDSDSGSQREHKIRFELKFGHSGSRSLQQEGKL